ncbi:MAG: CBS domain-containing protein, partial [Thermomicrobiales bacterium]
MTTFEPDHSSLVYVVGHKNPDTDTICSAIAYAVLRRATDLPGATPARLGPLWAETAAALARCGVEPPLLLADVRQRVADVMNPDVVTAREDDTLYDAARTMREQRKRLLPVVDDARRLRGVLTLDDLAARYLSDMTIAPEGHGPLALDHFLRVSGGTLLEGTAGRHFTGRVWIGAARVETLHARIT